MPSTPSTRPAAPAASKASQAIGTPGTPWLAVQAVTLAYGTRSVVTDLSFSLARGQIGCLLGPSGCGKTTVLRAIAGFESPRMGRIELDGETIAAPGRTLPPEARQIGMVFQDHALFPHLSVEDNVGFALRGRPGAAERVRRLLETVGLADAARRWPHELSGGQQQRIALARALAPMPRLLLLDEPFSNLDVDLRERLGAELRALLAAEGTTALLVTHDQHEAFAVADEIGIMSNGRLQQWDTAYNLYHRPANRVVADFVGQGAFLPGEVATPHDVRVEFGQVTSAEPIRCTEHGDACEEGCPVDLLLRPDDVVHDDASPATAEVVAKAFRGAEFLYTLRLPSGHEVLSLVPSHHNHAIGERIGIRLELDHVVAFRRDAATRGPIA